MATLKSLSIGVADQFKIDPRKIQVEPGYNIRVFDSVNDEEDLKLKNQIRESGVKQPMTVRVVDDVIYVVAGHRRLAAVKELIEEGHPIVSVPAISEPRWTNPDERNLDLILSNEGKQLSAMERAEVIKRQIKVFNWTEEKIAQCLGITVKQIQNLLILTTASPEIKEMISTHVVSPTQAIAVIKAEGDKATEVLTEARAVATAAGKTKVTAGTMKPKAVAVPVPVPVPVAPQKLRMVQTPAKFKEFYDVLEEILLLDDVKAIHCMVQDTLHIDKKSAA